MYAEVFQWSISIDMKIYLKGIEKFFGNLLVNCVRNYILWLLSDSIFQMLGLNSDNNPTWAKLVISII